MPRVEAQVGPGEVWRIAREDQVKALQEQIDALTERIKSWTETHTYQSRKRREAHNQAHEAVEMALRDLEGRIRRIE